MNKRGMTNYEKIFEQLGELKGITSATLEQAKKTNGRVTKLEERTDGIDVKMATESGIERGITISRSRLYAFLTLLIALAGVIAYLYK